MSNVSKKVNIFYLKNSFLLSLRMADESSCTLCKYIRSSRQIWAELLRKPAVRLHFKTYQWSHNHAMWCVFCRGALLSANLSIFVHGWTPWHCTAEGGAGCVRFFIYFLLVCTMSPRAESQNCCRETVQLWTSSLCVTATKPTGFIQSELRVLPSGYTT